MSFCMWLLTGSTAQAVSDLAVVAALAWVVTAPARAQVSGVLFAAASVLVTALAFLVVGVTASFLAVVQPTWLPLGASIEGTTLNKMSTLFSLRAAQRYRYRFDPDEQASVDRYVGIDREWFAEGVAAGKPNVTSFTQLVEPKSKTPALEILGDRSAEFGSAFLHLRSTSTIVVRLTAIMFPVIAILATLEARGSIAWLTLVQGSVTLALAIALGVFLVLMVRFQVVRFYVPPEILEARPDDAEFLRDVGERYFRPHVDAEPEFYSILRGALLRLEASSIMLNLLALGLAFAATIGLSLAWPGAVGNWSGYLPKAFGIVLAIAVIYLGLSWLMLVLVQSLGRILQPIIVAAATGASTVLLIYVCTGSTSLSHLGSSVGTAIGPAVAAGLIATLMKSSSNSA